MPPFFFKVFTMTLFTVYKQDGTEVLINANSVDAAKALGWTKTKPKAKEKEVKKTTQG